MGQKRPKMLVHDPYSMSDSSAQCTTIIHGVNLVNVRNKTQDYIRICKSVMYRLENDMPKKC
jgi:hypothetical protein